jgi:hypothetical protein
MIEKRHATTVRLIPRKMGGFVEWHPVPTASQLDRRSVNLHRVSETMRAQLVVEPVDFLKSAEVPDKAGNARYCRGP